MAVPGHHPLRSLPRAYRRGGEQASPERVPSLPQVQDSERPRRHGGPRMSDQTERMEDALRRVIGEKIAAEGEAERLRAALEDAVKALNWRDNEIRLGIRDEL